MPKARTDFDRLAAEHLDKAVVTVPGSEGAVARIDMPSPVVPPGESVSPPDPSANPAFRDLLASVVAGRTPVTLPPSPTPNNPMNRLQAELAATEEQYRQMLAEENARLAARDPDPREKFLAQVRLTPVADPAFPAAPPAFDVVQHCFLTGDALRPITYREGVDPLTIEQFEFLRRLIAGGALMPGSQGQRDAESLVRKVYDQVRAVEDQS